MLKNFQTQTKMMLNGNNLWIKESLKISPGKHTKQKCSWGFAFWKKMDSRIKIWIKNKKWSYNTPCWHITHSCLGALLASLLVFEELSDRVLSDWELQMSDSSDLVCGVFFCLTPLPWVLSKETRTCWSSDSSSYSNSAGSGWFVKCFRTERTGLVTSSTCFQ